MSDAVESIYSERDVWRFRIGILKRKYWRWNSDIGQAYWPLISIWYQKPWGTFRRIR